MASTYHQFKGKISYAKIFTPDDYEGDIRYCLNFYPLSSAERDKVIASGFKGSFRKDKNGNEYCQFRRPVERTFGARTVIFHPPVITGEATYKYTDDEGKIIRSYDKEDGDPGTLEGEMVNIGAGTEANVTICVYDARNTKGHRLESVHITDLNIWEENSAKTKEQKEIAEQEGDGDGDSFEAPW